MDEFIRGDVVVVPFPFSDLSSSKKRPAYVVASLSGDDVILCQITSQVLKDTYAVSLKSPDFIQGELSLDSNIRPNRLFTADKKIILYKIGSVNNEKLTEVTDRLIEIVK